MHSFLEKELGVTLSGTNSALRAGCFTIKAPSYPSLANVSVWFGNERLEISLPNKTSQGVVDAIKNCINNAPSEKQLLTFLKTLKGRVPLKCLHKKMKVGQVEFALSLRINVVALMTDGYTLVVATRGGEHQEWIPDGIKFETGSVYTSIVCP